MIQIGLALYLMIGIVITEVNSRFYDSAKRARLPLFKFLVLLTWPIWLAAFISDFCRFVWWFMFWRNK